MAERKEAFEMTEKETSPQEVEVFIDPKKEKKLVRKLDCFITPVYMFTYMISYVTWKHTAVLGNWLTLPQFY